MRTRIRAGAGLLVTLMAVFAFAAPAFAEEGSGASVSEQVSGESGVASAEGEAAKQELDKFSKECLEILEEGGKLSECQQAPSPLLPELNEIIWGVLAFLVLLAAMWKWGVPAVKNMEAQREERIRNDLEGAERARAEAEAEKQQYEAQIADARNEGGRIIEEARQSAEQVRRDLIARAEAEAEEIRARARADIANQQAQAMTQLQGDVANLAIDLAGRVVEKNLDSDTNRQLVDSFIEQVGRSN